MQEEGGREKERERRRMGGVSGFAGAISVWQRWRKMESRGVREQGMDVFSVIF